ncbi:IclR family transcriptional regulator C-terminal domain-containing protein [Actinocorallia sp. A-T 12471]|uniref:IclR family transcriptional regulator domain-containing protein n=1 Tax=Actinocorallia sp. A-T 12471 TaxID=3089813 RepID=UPI0029D14E11|nr:IclR family transcriptional regulator C-terminal domain-containing protein [Actinocorallia sp. A-T 12471]MDX6740386.1 IclR family transcriptional regulator C-terminal domain-containing protein [Actinocorallia sp. A-T 12471]
MGQETSIATGPLERGLEVINLLGRARDPQRPADLVKATGLVRSTVDRVVSTLVQIGYARWQGREVVAAPRLMELGNAYLEGSGFAESLGPMATALAEELDESVSVAVPDGDGARFVVQSPRRRAMSVAFRVGDLLPAELCAPGPIFAADWNEARWARFERRIETGGETDDPGFSVPLAVPEGGVAGFRERVAEAARVGWAADDQLIEPGLIAVALPVRGPSGAVECALSVVSHTSRHDVASLRERVTRAAAERVSAMEEALRRPRPGGVREQGTDRSRDLKRELGPEFLQSLDRGLAVLASLGAHPGGLTISESAEATGLPRATARRSLMALEALGYARLDGRRYVLLPKVLDLGYAELSTLTFADVAMPHLRALVDRVQDSASLAVLDGPDIRYVARVPASRIMRVAIDVGTRFPAWATSMGRVLLAALPESERAALLPTTTPEPFTRHTHVHPTELHNLITAAAADGHALVDQELDEGLRSVAVPVRDSRGTVIAALNVATHAGPAPAPETAARLLPALRQTAQALEADLASYPTLPTLLTPHPTHPTPIPTRTRWAHPTHAYSPHAHPAPPGSRLAHAQLTPGPRLAHARPMPGPRPARAWPMLGQCSACTCPEPGPCPACVRFAPGSCPVCARFAPGLHPACTWLVPGLRLARA